MNLQKQEVHNKKHWEKMSFDDIIQDINNSIAKERKERGISVQQHLVPHTFIVPKKGAYKTCTVNVYNINKNKKDPTLIIQEETTDNILIKEKDSFADLTSRKALQSLITFLVTDDNFNKLVEGTYDRTI